MRHVYGPITTITLFTFLALAGCQEPVAPIYQTIQNFKVEKIGIGESVVSADLQYYNPNNYKVNLKKAELDFYLDNKLLGHSILDTLIEIPKRDTFLIPVRLKMDLKHIFSNALTILLFNEIDVKVTGKARIGKGGVYINLPIQYEGKQKLNLFE